MRMERIYAMEKMRKTVKEGVYETTGEEKGAIGVAWNVHPAYGLLSGDDVIVLDDEGSQE